MVLASPYMHHRVFKALRQNIKPPVELVELNMHVNDPAFAAAIADRLLEMLAAQEQSK